MEKAKLNIKLVIFSVIANRLKVYQADSGLPAGLSVRNETLDRTAKKIYHKQLKAPLTDIYFEQLYTFSSQNSQISVVYYFLVPEHKIYPDKDIWVDTNNIKINKSDKEIILYAVQRLRWKIEYTNVVYSLLPPEFTFSQLQSIYESILGKALDKRNFRKKILSLNIIKDTGHLKNLGKARPAEMFAFKEKKLTFVQIL